MLYSLDYHGSALADWNLLDHHSITSNLIECMALGIWITGTNGALLSGNGFLLLQHLQDKPGIDIIMTGCFNTALGGQSDYGRFI